MLPLRFLRILQIKPKQFYQLSSCLCSVAVEQPLEQHTDKFEQEFFKNRIMINPFQRAMLAVGSAAMAITDPSRGDMIACMGEVTGNFTMYFIYSRINLWYCPSDFTWSSE